MADLIDPRLLLRQGVAVTMMAALLVQILLPVPATATVPLTPEQEFTAGMYKIPGLATGFAATQMAWVNGLVGKFGNNFGFLAFLNTFDNESENARKAAEISAAQKALAERVRQIETQNDSFKQLSVGQTIQLAALPLDENGVAVHGITPEWSADNDEILTIDGNRAVAKTIGETRLTVKAGATEEHITVKVEANGEQTIDQTADKPAEAKTSKLSLAGKINAKEMAPPLPMMMAPNPNGGDNEPYEPENNPGTPYGQVEADSPNTASAARIRHRAGAANYSFSVPFASLPGRGIDASVGMTYNSRVWTKSGEENYRSFTFNSGKSWFAPGFTMGYGELTSHFWSKQTERTSGNSYALATYNEIVPEGFTDPDGTRHQISCKTWSTIPGSYHTAGGDPYMDKYCSEYITTDGSFIKVINHTQGVFSNYNVEDRSIYTNAYFTLIYPNGSKVVYSVPGSQFGGEEYVKQHYPNIIQDRNGNKIQVAYKDNTDKIDYIRDTVGRYIRFYYDTTTEKNLVAVTVPGFNNGADHQTIRFYYEKNVTLNYSNQFSALNIFASATINTLKYIYFPATGAGYRYDYHTSFGMITKITQLRGTTVSTDSLTTTGSVTAEGATAATTEYAFQNGNQFPLTDVPKYTQRTDDWAGRPSTVSVPVTLYDAPEAVDGYDRTSTVTVQDTGFNVEYKTLAYNLDAANTDYWKNGLIKETSVVKRTGSTPTLMSKTVYNWEQGAAAFGGRQNPILRSVEVTNDAGQISKTRYEYDNYNNQTAVEEYGFKVNGNYPTTPLKRAVTTYETNSAWIDMHLLGLPNKVEVYDNGQIASKTLIEYDNATLEPRSDIAATLTHDTAYNPAVSSSPVVYRGNVTKVVSLSDATKTNEVDDTNASVTTKRYDIAGNPVEATLNCCQLKTWNYGATFADTGYAYVVEEKRGPGGLMTTSATYDKNTGLMKTATDENNQVMANTYDPNTLRATRTDFPNGGYSTIEYSDGTISSVKTKTRIDSIKESESWQFADGRGATFRTRTRTPEGQYLSSDVEYDKLGRVKYSYNPYTAATADLSSTRPSNTPSTSVEQYDALGRALQIKLQDNTIVENTYSGTVSVVIDQAGKKRRQIADGLGRIVRVDEPNAQGLLDNGDINAPYQPTYYEYDGNDNLSKVTQTEGSITQERVFVYDSLSRLLRERQPEMSATLLSDGTKTSAASTNWTGVYKYNRFGLLTEGVDARGVKSTLGYDTLNRLETVVYSGEGSYKTPSVTYHYDEARNDANNNPYFNKDRMTRVETIPATGSDIPATVQVFDYDKMGQTIKQIQQVGSQSYTLKYGYNLANQMVTEEYPTGKVVRTAVDSMGRTARVYDARQTFVSGLQYAGTGQLSSMYLGNGTQETYGYDQNRLQLNSQALLKGTQILSRYDYAYGKVDLTTGAVDATKNNGQLARVNSFIGGTAATPTKQFQQRFEYDSLGRISESREYHGANDEIFSYKQHFDYDRFGNLYRKAQNNTTSGQETPIAYNAIEETTDINKATNRFTTTTGTLYDDAGNVTKDVKFRNFDYTYDANNRMVKAQVNNVAPAPTASLSTYDAAGQRVATQIGDAWRFMVYDINGQIVCEFTTEISNRPTTVQYLFADRQGSTRAITNSTGAVSGRNDFSAFGEEIGAGVGTRALSQGYNAGSPTRNKYGLTERDEATGLDHTSWRKHENKSGRWTSPDPYKGSMNLGDPQSFNRYSYVGNQPTDFVDPSGLLMRLPAGCTAVYDDNQTFQYIECTTTSIVYGLGPWGGYTARNPRELASIEGEPLLPEKNDCENFVDSLVSDVEDRINDTTATINVGAHFASRAYDYYKTLAKDGNKNTDGFKNELIKDGQGNDVYRHITAAAASILLDGVGAFSFGDELREGLTTLLSSEERGKEAAVSSRDNRAGEAVGNVVNARLVGTIKNAEELRDRIKNILCGQ